MTKQKYPALQSLDFGRLDAKEEAAVSPELLRSGYYDFEKAAYRVARREGWVLVGPKGAGKTASLEHLDLMWAGRHDCFLDRWELASFPVADVAGLRVGGSPGPTSTRAAWEFLLLLRVFASLMRDQGASYPGEVTGFHKSLVKAGLIGPADLRTRFDDWSRSTAKFNVLFFTYENESGEIEATPLQLVELLKRAIEMVETSSQHLLAIDGLDSFFAQSETQSESLGALLDAVYDLNTALRGGESRASILLAIRHDMFAKVPSTDSAKLGDHAVELDWSRGGSGAGNELWSLVNAKVRASIPPSFDGLTLGDVRKAYLAQPIGIGPHTDIPGYFLSHTRLLPRDLVALMRELQGVHKGSGQVRQEEAREAVRLYSETYFVREITNNLSRVLPTASSEKVSVLLDALSALPNREFNVRSLQPELDGFVSNEELRVLLKQLFLVGGLGVRSKSQGTTHTNFSFRRTSGGGFSFIADYVLHNSLAVAWNLNW